MLNGKVVIGSKNGLRYKYLCSLLQVVMAASVQTQMSTAVYIRISQFSKYSVFGYDIVKHTQSIPGEQNIVRSTYMRQRDTIT